MRLSLSTPPCARFVLSVLMAGMVSLTTGLQSATAETNKRRVADTSTTIGPQSRGEKVDTKFQFPVGAIVIVNNERRLYYITAPGQAVRYRVAVGKQQELWMGRTFVAAKVVNPKWIPINGDDPVEGGDAANPLGKRALYLDWSLLRIHGTPSRGSIGSAVSNGCIRMLNEDVMDLFDRVHFGAPVYAIRSWKDPSLYQSVPVAEKIYADPQAHEQAKEELQEQLRERALDARERDANARRERRKTREADASTVRVNGRSAIRYPGRLALGR